MKYPISYPEDPAAFEEVRADLERGLSLATRFPAWPFHVLTGQADVCQFSHIFTDSFADVVSALASDHGETYVVFSVLEPTPSYYREYFGSFPAFKLAQQDISAEYADLVTHEPGGDATGTPAHTADVVALAGSSGGWALYAERRWDLAVVLTQITDGPWTRRDVPFVPVETALADFTEPPYKLPLDAKDRAQFLSNVHSRGTLR